MPTGDACLHRASSERGTEMCQEPKHTQAHNRMDLNHARSPAYHLGAATSGARCDSFLGAHGNAAGPRGQEQPAGGTKLPL